MKYNLALPDEFNSHFEIRNDAGMNIGIAFQNEHPFDGCKPVTMEDAENNARLWAAAPELLEALESVIRLEGLIAYPKNVDEVHINEAVAINDMLILIKKAIAKAKAI